MPINESQLRKMIAPAGTRAGLWRNVLRAADVRVMAEFGVWKGNFAQKLLAGCGFIELYYMVDPWAFLSDWNRAKNVETENFEDVYAQAMAATAFAEQKLCVLRGKTKDVIHKIPDQSLDFAYIDGDHTLRGVTIDLIKVLPKMKPGGLIGGDDFFAKPWPHSPKFEPTMVCPFSIYFAEANDLPMFALPYNQFLMINQPDAGFSFTDIPGSYGDISLNDIAGKRAMGERRQARRGVNRQAGPGSNS